MCITNSLIDYLYPVRKMSKPTVISDFTELVSVKAILIFYYSLRVESAHNMFEAALSHMRMMFVVCCAWYNANKPYLHRSLMFASGT